MSRKVIDDRVVEMEFDNENFEKNVSTSLSTLDKLKAALSFNGASKEFDEVDSSIEGLGKSFNVFEQIAIGALRRIGDGVASWAAGMIRDLSGVGNMIQGFSKFGEITKATGTMKAQGYELSEIEDQLDRLNWFTDETSYNLSDMVGNISKFTAAGQSLEDSADAMMGIALWAALSGKGANDASRAMYQLSQAIGAGVIRREDWKSIEMLNMNTVEFKQKALDAAVALKTLKKNADGTYSSLKATGKNGGEAFTIEQFATKLTEGAWFTSDVFMKVAREYSAGVNQLFEYTQETGKTASEAIEDLEGEMDKFALKAFKAGQEARTWEDVVQSIKDAASTGWMNIYQDLFGNYDQAVRFFTDMANRFYDIFVEPINRLTELFDRWGEATGRSNFIQGLHNIVSILENLIKRVRKIFDKITYGTTKEEPVFGFQLSSLLSFTKRFAEITGTIAETIDKSIVFRRYLRAFLTIFSMGSQIVSQFGRAIKDSFSGSGTIIGKILELVSYVAREFYKLGKWTKANDSFYKFFTFALKPIKNIKDLLVDFVENGLPKIEKRWNEFRETFTSKMKKPLENLKKSFKDLFGVFSNLWGGSFKNLTGEGLADAILGVFDKIKNAFYFITGLKPGEFLNKVAGGVSKLGEKLANVRLWLTEKDADTGMNGIEKIQNKIESAFEWIKSNIGPIWETVKGWLKSAFEWISTNWDTIWGAISGVATAIWNFFKSIGQGFASVFGKDATEPGEDSLSRFSEFIQKLGEFIGKLFGLIERVATPVLEGLSNAISNLTFADFGKIFAGGGIALLGAAAVNFTNVLREFFALDGIRYLIGGIGEVLDSFSGTLDAKAFKDFAIATAIFVAALLILTGLPIDKLTEYGTAFAGFIAEIVLALRLLRTGSTMVGIGSDGFSLNKRSSGIGFIGIALGLLLIAGALRMISKIPKDDLKKAEEVIITILLVVSACMALISKFATGKVGGARIIGFRNTNKLIGGPAATILAFAILLLSVTVTLKSMSKMIEENSEAFNNALMIVTGILFAMAAFLLVMKAVTVGPNVAATIVAFAASMYILAEAIRVLTIPDADKVQNAALVLGIVMAAFAALARFSSAGSFASFGTFAGGLILFSVAVGIIAAIIYLLAKSEHDIDGAAVVVAGIIALMIGLAAVSSTMTMATAENLAAIAGSMVIFAAAVAIIAAAIYLLASNLDADQMERGLTLIIVITLAFATLTIVASKTGTAVVKLGVAFALIAGAIALLAAAVYFLVKAFEILSTDNINVEKISENINSILKMLKEELPEWLVGFATAILEALIALVNTAAIALINVLVDVLERLHENQTVSKLANSLADLVIDFCNAMAPRMPELIASVCTLVLSIIQGINTWLVENAESIGQTLYDGLVALWNVFVGFFNGIGEAIFGDNWENVKASLEEAAQWVKENIIDKINGWITDIINGIMEALVWLGIIEDYRPAAVAAADKEAQEFRLNEYYRNQYDKEHPNWMKNNENNPLEMSRISQERMAWVEKQVADALSKGLDVSASGSLIAHELWADNIKTEAPLGAGNLVSDYDKKLLEDAIAAANSGGALPTYSPPTNRSSVTDNSITNNWYISGKSESEIDQIYRQTKNLLSRHQRQLGLP